MRPFRRLSAWVLCFVTLSLLLVLGCSVSIGPGPTAGAPDAATVTRQVQEATSAPATATSLPPSPSPTALPAETSTPSPTATAGAVKASPPPMAPAPTAGCSSGPPPESLSAFGSPSQVINYGGVQYYYVGRDLMVDLVMVESEGTTSGADLVSIESESCSIDSGLEYDWVYTVWYSSDCPTSLADIAEPESGPWGVYVVGRSFYRDGALVTSEGQTSDMPTEESWTCEGHSYRCVVYWSGEPGVPEANTLILLGSGVTALAGWVALQRRRRGR